MKLPDPARAGGMALSAALDGRRSVREFASPAMTLAEAAQLLWAAQGRNDAAKGYRTAPSAGATFPLETYLVAGDVAGLDAGVYRYVPASHTLQALAAGDLRRHLGDIACDQKWLRDSAAIVVFSAIVQRTAVKYRERAVRYVQFEAGHAAQNLMLQAVALDLGSTAIGAFEDDKLKTALGLGADEVPLYMVAVGRPKEGGSA